MPPPDVNSSLLGTIIQCSGIALIAILSFFLTRSIKRDFLNFWSLGWACLTVGLGALYLSFRRPDLQPLAEPVYFIGEYAFGYLLVAGVRSFATGARLARRDLLALAPALALAVLLSRWAEDFTVRFVPQAAILSVIFAVAFYHLERARRAKGPSPGLSIMSVALVLLTVDFAQYVPVFMHSKLRGWDLPVAYSSYTAIYDLLFETLLGFGTVTLVLEDVRGEVEAANRELRAARDRLEALVRVDPLTESLSRHAFYSMLETQRTSPAVAPRGCVVVADIDFLKPINDSLGHAAGDAAIRTVAGAMRSVVRATDLVFRWGGDEFLVVLFGVSEEEARRRFLGLGAALRDVSLPGGSAPRTLSVSYGLAAFSETVSLDKAIENADAAMYAAKQARNVGRPA